VPPRVRRADVREVHVAGGLVDVDVVHEGEAPPSALAATTLAPPPAGPTLRSPW